MTTDEAIALLLAVLRAGRAHLPSSAPGREVNRKPPGRVLFPRCAAAAVR